MPNSKRNTNPNNTILNVAGYSIVVPKFIIGQTIGLYFYTKSPLQYAERKPDLNHGAKASKELIIF